VWEPATHPRLGGVDGVGEGGESRAGGDGGGGDDGGGCSGATHMNTLR
jgi:hypothetical protein